MELSRPQCYGHEICKELYKTYILKNQFKSRTFCFCYKDFLTHFLRKILISILLYQTAIFNHFQLFTFLTSHFGDVEDSFHKKFELEGEFKLGELWDNNCSFRLGSTTLLSWWASRMWALMRLSSLYQFWSLEHMGEELYREWKDQLQWYAMPWGYLCGD